MQKVIILQKNKIMEKTKKKIKRVNLGKVLKKNIKKMGLKKYVVAEALDIQRPTLNTRLEDGEFKTKQIDILIEKGWLPADSRK